MRARCRAVAARRRRRVGRLGRLSRCLDRGRGLLGLAARRCVGECVGDGGVGAVGGDDAAGSADLRRKD